MVKQLNISKMNSFYTLLFLAYQPETFSSSSYIPWSISYFQLQDAQEILNYISV